MANHVSERVWRDAWKQASVGFGAIQCSGCGSTFSIEDDGTPSDEGGLVARTNISQPKITGVNSSSGPRTGGNHIFLLGERLDVGSTLAVKFSGKPAAVVDTRSDESARVAVPSAIYQLNVAETLYRFTVDPIYQALEVEAITTQAGSTGQVRFIEGQNLWAHFEALTETLPEMIGSVITGGSSGSTATLTSIELAEFEPGETLVGLTSGATGQALLDTHGLKVDSPTNGFAPNELVRGVNTLSIVRLGASPAYSGVVNITVENEFGQRVHGGVLVDAYTYA